MAIYKKAKCPHPGCNYNRTESTPVKTGTWCQHCKTWAPEVKAKCQACGKTALESGPPCPKTEDRHPGQPARLFYSAKWYVKAAGLPARAISTRKADAIGEEAALTKNRIEGRGHLNHAHRTQWKDARRQFLEWARNNVAPGTVDRMFIPSLDRLEWRVSTLTLDRITPEMIEEHKAKYLAKGNAASTINSDLTTIKRLMKKSVEWGLVDVNRLASVERLTEADPRERYLTEAEIEKLLDRCKRKAGCKCESVEKCTCKVRRRPYTYIITLTGLHSGLRLGDILTLRRNEVDFAAGVIRKQLQKKKTKKAVTIPMTPTLAAALKAHVQKQPASISGYLFPSPRDKSKPMHHNGNFGFKEAVIEAGLVDFRFHDLRHTFATIFLKHMGITRGKDTALLMLKELLGHTDTKTTQRYAHVLDEYLRDAVADFGTVFTHR